MSAPEAVSLRVLRGNPTPEELAGLVAVFAALRGNAGEPDPPPARGRWGRPADWHPPQPDAPDAAGWQRTPAPTHERSTR
ncbi:acyl-CoA carboxylase subunit epsilon [Streptomyces sp. Qhu-G9]|uniref:acyl-CoA carboxylase subunit epsilon n=1 Tax=Streptomyces sp. Qhu-G9 TaxID=3452799 RepID=UPI0022AC8F5D|nr:acyl-CoA carboxylase subunit epsilon [Streptomyces aurantiacus]WAU82325.1 acyl-CoA carboxylase subunit epsilon [Streptomyces aurantiacus]